MIRPAATARPAQRARSAEGARPARGAWPAEGVRPGRPVLPRGAVLPHGAVLAGGPVRPDEAILSATAIHTELAIRGAAARMAAPDARPDQSPPGRRDRTDLAARNRARVRRPGRAGAGDRRPGRNRNRDRVACAYRDRAATARPLPRGARAPGRAASGGSSPRPAARWASRFPRPPPTVRRVAGGILAGPQAPVHDLSSSIGNPSTRPVTAHRARDAAQCNAPLGYTA